MSETGFDRLGLARAVERMRRELEALRGARLADSRVEQAKGLLAERLGCGVEEAYDHLLSLAAGAGVDPAAAAGLLLGVPVAEEVKVGSDVFDPAAYLPAAAPPTACAAACPAACAPSDAPSDDMAPTDRPGAVLDVVQCPAALLSPVRDDGGRIVDFHVDAVNADATDKPGHGPHALVGRRLLESYPGLALSDLLQEYARVVETGLPLRRGPREYASLDRGRVLPTTMSVRACRIGGRLLVSWQFHDARGDLSAQLDQAQRLGNLGWAEWNLLTGEGHWSDQLHVIFGRDRSAGPLPLDGLAELVHPDDLGQAQHLMRTVVARREPAEVELRILTGGATRHLRVMAEPVLDATGEPVLLRCVFQDVTSGRRAERLLADSRRELERSRRRVAEERHIALELQRAILPLPRHPVDLPGLRVAVRYLPAESEARIGGDWYEAAELPAGEVFLAIGDVSGHGLPAAATMAALRNALSGLAFTGAPPDLLLRWLNRLLLHRRSPVTASGIAATFDPASRTMAWAQAGHPPPVLVRAGTAELLRQPDGMLLGAVDDPVFAVGKLGLLPGDLLLFYTDGLVERRHRDLGDGMSRLVETAGELAKSDPDPESALEHTLTALGTPNPDDDTCVIAVRIL